MAVRKGDQEQGRLQVIEASKVMTKYTYDRVRDKTFPKADRWIMPKGIWDEVLGAHTKIVRANALRIDIPEEAKERLLLQKEAIGHLDAADSLIDICHMNGVISDDRADYWSGLVTNTQSLAKSWHKKDRKTAGDCHGFYVR
ncbi:MAG: hypothetical protein IJG39_02465 [Synergistaceae bacterium]|nr:hypothetical protein [Synergistaceae bacterium]